MSSLMRHCKNVNFNYIEFYDEQKMMKRRWQQKAGQLLAKTLHDREVEKIAESGQLWELISPQSFAENTHIFALSCVNSPKISKTNLF